VYKNVCGAYAEIKVMYLCIRKHYVVLASTAQLQLFFMQCFVAVEMLI